MTTPPGGPRVVEFSEDAFYKALSGDRFSVENAQQHRQAQYLYAYLGEIDAKRIVVEDKYVDGDYLADFASYYVSCFEPYDRLCKRLHFFSSEFNDVQLEQYVLRKKSKREFRVFRRSYLGFIVVRPLPDAVIGRSALKTYPSDGGRRHYTALAPYRVTLYGIHLVVRSLAFQEQDTVLAACATVAIWSALHRTAHLWGTRAIRPHAITAEATRVLGTRRALPTSGLLVEQMLPPIQAAGLEPESYLPEVSWGLVPLASLIYAYCRGGLPVILIGRLEQEGPHAVTIAGYSLNRARVAERERADRLYVTNSRGDIRKSRAKGKITTPGFIGKPIPLTGLRIDEFYAHDDGTGPFSRLVVRQPEDRPYLPTDPGRVTQFETQRRFDDGRADYQIMTPVSIVMPVYPKIRLRFDDVLMGWIPRVHSIFSSGAGVAMQDLYTRTEWDIFLIETNTYKDEVRALSLHERRRSGLLRSSQPRFIWRAILRVDGVERVELLIDATSFAAAFPVFAINWFDEGVARAVKALIERDREAFGKLLSASLEQLILAEIEQRDSDVIGVPQKTSTAPGSAVMPGAPATG